MSSAASVSERQTLSRLKVPELRELCRNRGIPCGKRTVRSELLEALVQQTWQNKENAAPQLRTNLEFDMAGYYKDPDVRCIPPVKFGHVYEHIVEGSGRNSKCLQRGIKHFDDGDIQDLYYNEISHSEIWFRCKCVASQRKRKYEVYCAIQQECGTCLGGKCDCPQGALGNCSHVAGLLLALEFISRTKSQNPGNISCTSRLCLWRKPRALNVQPKPLANINIRKPGYQKDMHVDNRGGQLFDPRHEADREEDTSRMNSQMKELLNIFPMTGMQQLWGIPVETPEVEMEVELEVSEWDRMAEALIVQSPIYDLSTTIGLVDILNFIEGQTISQALSEHVELSTRAQSLSPLWRNLHTGRLTSSTFGEVFTTLPSSKNKSLICRLMGYKQLERLPWAMRWGKDKEKQATCHYEQFMDRKGTPVEVRPTGLTLSTSHSFLGASSDGLVTDSSQPEGLRCGALEVKCPCSFAGEDVRNKTLKQLSAQNVNFCLELRDAELHLKSSHPYYAQVQGEMAIMSLPWVDFVVWTLADMHVQRIYFDVEFWEGKLFPKLYDFYKEKLVPEILSGKLFHSL